MMTKIGDAPAWPQSETLVDDGAHLVRTSHGGMTYRQWLIGQALAGYCANPNCSIWDHDEMAENLLITADATLALMGEP